MNTALKIAATCVVFAGWAGALLAMASDSNNEGSDRVAGGALLALGGFSSVGTVALLCGIWLS